MSILHTVSDLTLRYLPESWFLSLRVGYFTFRRKLDPLSRFIYGTFEIESLRDHLEERLGSDFEVLMVHSSVNHMSPAYTGSPLELVRMLIDFCGPDRTLVMPAFYFGDPKIGSVQETFKTNRKFDLKKVPSQMGLATELFRRTKGVVQSRHPIYRVSALGPLAMKLVQGHENASCPAGSGSPFEFMATHDTLIVGIGKSYHVMTQVHHVDNVVCEQLPESKKIPERDSNIDVTVIDGDEDVPVSLKGSGIQWRFNISKLPDLLNEGDLEYWKFHNVPLFAARASNVTNSLIEAAKEGKTIYDPI